MPVADAQILERVAQGLKRASADPTAMGRPHAAEPRSAGPVAAEVGRAGGAQGSILAQAAAVYGAKPDQPEATPGTGFDPVAAALFEALVEGAFLVAHADGVVDDEERAAFEQVVASAASAGSGSEGGSAALVRSLLADLSTSLAEDGLERRIEILAHAVSRAEHRAEVLRVAALVAHVSGGVSAPERGVMEKLAARLDLGPADVDRAIADATAALAR
jgi:tellurite resistance protein